MKEVYASDMAMQMAPSLTIPEEGMPAGCAKTIISDEMLLDGSTLQNLATFVTTFMEPEAEELMRAGMRVNAIDFDEYPTTSAIHQRCVNMIGNLWNAKMEDDKITGTATVGSSEAIMLACLAMKWRHRAWRKEKGLTDAYKPNLVFGSNVQCCWHKACKYFEIEGREADISDDCLVLTAERAEKLVDENTIGVCPILGSTFNGEFEDVAAICAMVQRVNDAKGWNIPVHVDAASGGFIAPFTRPELLWDFRLPQVKSINASGHKFGLTYAGLGWLVFSEKASCPDDLVTTVDYLGGSQSSLTLNFSKPASTILAQYYMFLRLGKGGYAAIMKNGLSNAAYLRDMLKATGHFEVVDKGDMPLVAIALKDPVKSGFTLYDLQDALKARGWTVPAYQCPKGAQHLVIMRAVVKQNMSRNMIRLLVDDIARAIAFYEEHPSHLLHPKNKKYRDDDPRLNKKRKLDKAETDKLTHKLSRNITTRLMGGNLNHIENDNSTKGVC
ncbi:Glutamate decarboxylase 1 [Hondaea fermentalgiana]|uniref:Glutamate decarboxylase n=1 Tax=Hondaea fermentalgiana TaxID=2315210 RepID=A0A2R5G780_9STRA|nr:Glutamate decarboxylase 1 [Hondaea fermentalgiana]|eukprot:GBG26916.1 Glutamate decarboxylase 1 [Hondaea fermentalgiana]